MNKQNPPIVRDRLKIPDEKIPVDETPSFLKNDSVLNKEELASRIAINDPVNQFLKINVTEKVKFAIKYKNTYD